MEDQNPVSTYGSLDFCPHWRYISQRIKYKQNDYLPIIIAHLTVCDNPLPEAGVMISFPKRIARPFQCTPAKSYVKPHQSQNQT